MPSPTPGSGDTAARSLEHWSEAGRREMEDFYALAGLDYSKLARAADWGELLAGRRTLLDVACGSGKFPAALLREADLTRVGAPIAYDLLDPSSFSLAEAAKVLGPPFAEADRHETTLEDLDPDLGPWDVVWATHALYALDPRHLEAGAERLLAAIGPGGFGFVAQGTRDGHYLRVYEAFLDGVRGGDGTPYNAIEDVAEALRATGASLDMRRIRYDHVAPAGRTGAVEGYLQRCLFDDGLSLQDMLEAPVLGPYLAACRDPDGGWRFAQEVGLVTIDGPPA